MTRKLIEAALPLDAINAACLADKDRKVGTIRNVHKWFAPMPLPAWRALLLAALVDDPGDEAGRDALLELIEQLVASGADPPEDSVIRCAREVLAKSWPDGVPEVFDPFCGGGSTLIEAQRLGCPTRGSDLNPVPVLITRVLTEMLPVVNPAPSALRSDRWGGIKNLADAVAQHAEAVSEEGALRLSALYGDATRGGTIAWLWCRTATCPNPACGREAPLANTWLVSKRPGQELYLHPVTIGSDIHLELRAGKLPANRSPKRGRGASFECVACGAAISEQWLRAEGVRGRLGLRMTAVVEDAGKSGRAYRAPELPDLHRAAVRVDDLDVAEVALPPIARWFSPPFFGYTRFRDLHTPRQLAMLATFADIVAERHDAVLGEEGDELRARAISTLLGLGVGKLAQASSTIVRWNTAVTGSPKAEPAFARHDVAMQWDFAETNPWGRSVGDFRQCVATSLRALRYVVPEAQGVAYLADARSAVPSNGGPRLIATDPPYFDQIGYADLSDYFYLWHRRALRRVHPDLYATISAPKAGELVALAERHDGSRSAAKDYFVEGFCETFKALGKATSASDLPMLVVYAFKEQSARDSSGVPPGWEAILEAVVAAGLMVTGTWPIRGARAARMIGVGTNSLATYVVLVCRSRAPAATKITKTDFVRKLRDELSDSVVELQHANIAPVDLAQAVIGPGMRVYSQHSSVVDPTGTRVGVADALAQINRTLAEILDEQEGDLDPDSRWAVTWYEEYGFDSAAFGRADQLARAKGIAVNDLGRAGIVTSRANKVALIPREALADAWDPATDRRATAWEAVQYLLRALLDESGERGAAEVYAKLGMLADPARELAYRLFVIAERKGRIDEAIAYNSLVTSWSDIARLADEHPRPTTSTPTTEAMF